MNWFDGPIMNAITESQTKKLIFLVYTHDATPSEMDTIWDDETISSLCTENCISLKLEAESETCNQFKQLYPITIFPTTYFIGNNGLPIEVVSGAINKEILETKIQNAIQIHKTPKVETAAASPTTETNEDEQQKQKLDERVALAKERLRQLQEKKRLEEEDKEKESELERRKMGQEVLKSKKDREDQELKRIAEQKKQEKLDDILAKQRIKERIQQDREDKQKKYALERETIDKAKEQMRAQLELAKQQQQQNEAAVRSQIARIQFKLIDGSSIVNQFDPNETLSQAKQFISDKLKEMNESQSFSMHSTFPKRDYTESDMSQTLRDLQLAPSATILIMPIRSKASKAFSNLMPTTSSGTTPQNSVATYANDFLGFLLLPFTIIWGLVTSLIGINNAPTSSTRPASTSNRQPPVQDNIRIRNMRRNVGVPRSNVRSLHTDNDDDDNATWNGNSTQQM